MPACLLRCLAATAALATAWPVSADALSSGCELPMPEDSALADRAGLLARYERLPQACLRDIVTTCSHESSRVLMDFDSAAACSLGYEALLRQGFGGNFHALMAWWQSQKPAATP